MLVVTALIFLASCIMNGSLKMTAFTVDRSSVKTVYYIGEEIDFSGIRASVQYSDKSLNIEYTAKDLTVTYAPDITASVGTKTVTVSFTDPHLSVKQEAKVQITVKEDPNAIKHASYAVDFSGMKTTYFVGDTLDFTGVKIIEKFTGGAPDAEIVDLTGIEYIYSPDITASAGTKTVAVTFGGESAGTITVTVKKQDNAGDDIVSAVIGGSYNATYKVNEGVDLSGLTVTLTYQSGDTLTLTKGDLVFSDVDTSTPGEKTVIISFADPKDDEVSHSLPLLITVIKAKPSITQFENSSDLSAFESDNKGAGKTEYGQAGFQGEFLKGGTLYVIGDDNAFYLNPAFSTMDDLGAITTHKEFYSVVTVSVWKDGAYVELEARRGAGTNVYDYYDGEKLIVSVNTYEGEYLFYQTLEKVKISVLPDAEFYEADEDLKSIVLEARVIDAYNVYSAKELSLLHNADSYRDEWETFRRQHGLSMVDVGSLAGVVLHTDIHIGKSDVPAELFYVSDRDLVYYNKTTQTSYSVPKGTAYLKDDVQIYRRTGVGDFVIEGNFFTIDTKNFPLVASPAVFGSAAGKDYGSDYSNSALFLFEWSSSEDYAQKPAEVPNVTIQNVAFIGNAARDNWVDENDSLVTAGGLILMKSARHANTVFNNCTKNSFFISYMSEYGASLTVNDSKCYDSYQNAAFVFAHSTLSVNNSFINGTGGPVIIAQAEQYPENSGSYYNPITNVNNTVTDTALTGQEVWFQATQAESIIAGIKALSEGLQKFYQFPASFTKDEKLNILGALMPNVDSAEQLQDGMIQGTLLFDGKGTERWYTNPDWYSILTNPKFAQGKYFLSVADDAGATHTIAVDTANNGLALSDLAANPILPGSAAFAPFATADQIVLHVGGLSVIFELYH